MSVRKDKYRCPEPLVTDERLAACRYVEPPDAPSKAKPWARGACEAGAPGPRRPPLVTRGERVPELVARDGKVIEVTQRAGHSDKSAMIDWLNISFHESSFYWNGDEGKGVPVTDDQLIAEVSVLCESILGFGITGKRDRGANFYHASWTLGNGYGMVCYGGQRDTVLIMLNGVGCGAALEGWERRLYAFLEGRATRPRITRIDLAHDDYIGKRYGVDKALADYEAGLFSCGGRTPDCEMRGNWINPNGNGRTFNVGNRKNGKFLRVYEKGRQLGAPASEWVRVEGEFKSVDRDLPHEMLLSPGAYLAAMYPALGWLQGEQIRIATKTKEAEKTYARTVEWLKRQCGAALSMVAAVEGGAVEAFAKVGREFSIEKFVDGLESWEDAALPIHKENRAPTGGGIPGYTLAHNRFAWVNQLQGV